MLNSKEAIQELYNEREYLLGEKVNNKTKNWHNDITHYDNIGHCLLTIRQDLDRLEKLEKENQELKERYKHRAETSNDLCKAVKQYEKVIEILKSNLYLEFNDKCNNICLKRDKYDECDYTIIFPSKEEYELLKEWLEND